MPLSGVTADVITCAVHDCGEVESVARACTPVVLLEPSRTPLDEAHGADAVTPGCMGEPDTDLGEPLPEIPLFWWASLPSGLEDLMRREWSPVAQQAAGEGQRLRRRQGLFGDRLDAGSPVGQRPAKGVAWPGLSGAPSDVPVPVVGHDNRFPSRWPSHPDCMRSMLGQCPRNASSSHQDGPLVILGSISNGLLRSPETRSGARSSVVRTVTASKPNPRAMPTPCECRCDLRGRPDN